jgi:hypothetical protein
VAPGVDGVEGAVERAEVDDVIAAEGGGGVDGAGGWCAPEKHEKLCPDRTFAQWQAPVTHEVPVVQMFPHLPQFALSVWVFAQ